MRRGSKKGREDEERKWEMRKGGKFMPGGGVGGKGDAGEEEPREGEKLR